jgi:hypothetical protein
MFPITTPAGTGSDARARRSRAGVRVGVPQFGHRSGRSRSSSVYVHFRQANIAAGPAEYHATHRAIARPRRVQ